MCKKSKAIFEQLLGRLKISFDEIRNESDTKYYR